MESVDYYDKHLDPPDEPQYSDCDGCRNSFDTGDLKHIGARWLCDNCQSRYSDCEGCGGTFDTEKLNDIGNCLLCDDCAAQQEGE